MFFSILLNRYLRVGIILSVSQSFSIIRSNQFSKNRLTKCDFWIYFYCNRKGLHFTHLHGLTYISKFWAGCFMPLPLRNIRSGESGDWRKSIISPSLTLFCSSQTGGRLTMMFFLSPRCPTVYDFIFTKLFISQSLIFQSKKIPFFAFYRKYIPNYYICQVFFWFFLNNLIVRYKNLW